jgi:4-amino-4-deoxy-L-arabinose transferase-like glycosyltransferase
VPLGEDLADGNVNQIQLALLSLFLALQRRAPALAASVAAGTVLGLANAFKPNLAYVLVALTLGWLAERAWRRLLCCWAGVLLGVGAALVLSTLLFGTLRPWFDWLAVLRAIDQHYNVAVIHGNFGGARLLRELLGWSPVWLLQLAGWGLLLGALLASRARERDPGADFRREYLLAAAGAILPILTTSLAWPHYLMLALPTALYALVAPTPARADPRCVAAALLAVLGVLAAFPYVWWGLGGPLLHAATRALSAALFFGVAVAEIRRLG